MSNLEFRAADVLEPVKITHSIEQIVSHGVVEIEYNFLTYYFQTDTFEFRAKASLYEPDTVWLYGPFVLGSDYAKPAPQTPLDPRVVDYLSKRYEVVKTG
jgi:hypothetical protein